MEIKDIANRLVELCKVGDWDTAQKELYHEDCVSIEPEGMPDNVVKGMAAIKKKGEIFASMIEETHGGVVSEPLVADDYFSVMMGYDVTFKDRGRVKDTEICVFKVNDGKIVSEQFFYVVPPMG